MFFTWHSGARVGNTSTKRATTHCFIAALKELRTYPGARLFKLKTNDGFRPMTAGDLNQYLARNSGKPITAKDFRTLFASSVALNELQNLERPTTTVVARRAVAAVARKISIELANTPAVTRKSYIHPRIVESFEKGELEDVEDAPRKRNLSLAELRSYAVSAHLLKNNFRQEPPQPRRKSRPHQRWRRMSTASPGQRSNRGPTLQASNPRQCPIQSPAHGQACRYSRR